MVDIWITIIIVVLAVLAAAVHLINKAIGGIIETNNELTEQLCRMQQRLDRVNSRVIDMDREIGKLIAWHEMENKR